MIVLSPLHVPLYKQGSCIVPFNTNSFSRETSSWDHRDTSCGCPDKSLLAGSTNRVRYYTPYLECYQYLHCSSSCTYKLCSVVGA